MMHTHTDVATSSGTTPPLTSATAFDLITEFEREISRIIVGQQMLIRRLLTGLFSSIPHAFSGGQVKAGCGHVLLLGVPGVAKTLTATTLAHLRAARPVGLGLVLMSVAPVALWGVSKLRQSRRPRERGPSPRASRNEALSALASLRTADTATDEERREAYGRLNNGAAAAHRGHDGRSCPGAHRGRSRGTAPAGGVPPAG